MSKHPKKEDTVHFLSSCLAYAAPRAEITYQCPIGDPVSNLGDKFLTNTRKTQTEAATIIIRVTKTEELESKYSPLCPNLSKIQRDSY